MGSQAQDEVDLEAENYKKNDAEEYLNKVNRELEDLHEKKAELEKELYNNTDTPDGLAEELESVQNKLNKYNEQKVDALKQYNNSFERDLRNRGENIIDELDKERNEIQESKKELRELQDTAKGLLEKSTGTALGHQFADRKNEMERPLSYWKIAASLSIIVLIGASGGIFYNITQTSASLSTNISKVALLLPISVAVWFTISNYSRQKKLMEEYEFKSRIALSLEGFKEKLDSETTSENEDMKVAFLINAMENIQTNPQKNILEDSEDGENSVSNQTALIEYILDE